ncbi:dimethyl sulfoxide reductase anchor subunit family protein [Hansschlegelia sp.]|uniref:dimethyl sulfoxide reductase anchor subunit family protein n=1 Tax=Hansschlegelia sp. TaxID=2041892 RepID=UPI002C435CD7|nr:DmsC/YnfH family molybdoenzyme membrane anchor subunit [Hansschlegelia sp.]HVI27992.1 DmsC/YnfH family molybdoenzyme membrane anchor subunit [Hansschlegelia sp.]
MHPALSVIVFTTATGAGYGLLIWSGLLSAFSATPAERVVALVTLATALLLVTLGLMSSTLHLGRPERAWRALSQWRTSWLSREGLAAIATYVPATLLGLAWIVSPEPGLAAVLLGVVTACCAVVTIYCTAMIYASLKTVHQWRNQYVVPNYFALGLYCGALLFAALLHLLGHGEPLVDGVAAVAGLVALGGKLAYWRFISTTRHESTPESATGLGGIGKVRLFEAPHTEENYLMREMGFTIARRHADKLRKLVVLALFGAPIVLMLISLLLGGLPAGVAVLIAVLSAGAGVMVERWLFFAEAKHTVMLYYGARTA